MYRDRGCGAPAWGGAALCFSVLSMLGARQTFAEDGYILTVEEGDDEVVLNRYNSFLAGSSYTNAGLSSVSYQSAEGETVVVDGDSFIHYSSSLAAVTDGALADVDSYLEGVISCYSISAGNVLEWDGSAFTVTQSETEYRFENLVWKNSSGRYLLGSSLLTISFANGSQTVVETGFLELYYVDDDLSIIQLTDGENAWQVVAEGCTVTFANGVVLDCAEGELLIPVQDGEDSVSVSLSLSDIELGSASYESLGGSSSSKAPSFRFTLYDGVDGADGEDGADGTDGENGEDGADGADGSAGEDGQDGGAGSYGVGGYTDTLIRNGTTEAGDTIYSGHPEVVVATDGDTELWEIDENGYLSFSLVYDESSLDAVDLASESATVYLYNVGTGEILATWSGCTLSEVTEFSTYDAENNIDVQLEAGTTYAVIVVDSYTLGSESYTTRVMERMFTTDSSGVTAALSARSSSSFTASVTTTDTDYTTINSVTATVCDASGTVVTSYDSMELTDPDFSAISLSGLESDTWYQVTLTVNSTVNGVAVTEEKVIEWTTLKETPTVGGVSLVSDAGYMTASLLGAYDATLENGAGGYADVADADGAISSVTYQLYSLQNGVLTEVSGAVETSTGGSAWFSVDGSLLQNNVTYYLGATYIWYDGASTYSATVYESMSEKEDLFGTGAAWDSAMAKTSGSVVLSYSGIDTEIYNLAFDEDDLTAANPDSSEGTTYEQIRGSLSVDLNGTKISVNSVHTLDLVVTDGLTYEKTFSFDNCGGVQGDVEGSFALTLDLDGLLRDTTYALTLKAYIYDAASTTLSYGSLGTLTIHTDEEAEITVGLAGGEDGTVGVSFWLGSTDKSAATQLKNYAGEDDYEKYTTAAYRNLSSIVFELYQGTTTENVDPWGICTVYVTDGSGEKASFNPGESLLYEYYYGENGTSDSMTSNTVGVGEAFTYRFSYYKTSLGGLIPEDALVESGSYTIKVSVCYDYTYDRYESGSELYDYYTDANLDLEDFVNELDVVSNAVKVTYESRPISPSDVTVNTFAVTAETLLNGDTEITGYGETLGSSTWYDDGLLESTAVGVSLNTYFDDTEGYTRRVSFYGMSYTNYYTYWWLYDSSSTLSEAQGYQISDVYDGITAGSDEDGWLIPFKFTLWMTEDGTEADVADDTVSWETTIPEIRLLIGTEDMDKPDDGNAWESVKEYEDYDDRGYLWRWYDETNRIWYVYVEPEVLQRGTTYRFLYDAVMYYSDEEISWPEYCYDEGYIAGAKYQISTALSSEYMPFQKQEPYVNLQLVSTEYVDAASGATDTWQIYLNDPDGALLSDTLLGYLDDYEDAVAGGLLDEDGAKLTSQTGSTLTQLADSEYIHISFVVDSKTYTLEYKVATDGRFYAYLDNGSSSYVSVDTYGEDSACALTAALVEAMKELDDGASTDAFTDGTTVTISQLYADTAKNDGVYYSWVAGYRLIDDYRWIYYQGTMPLVSHEYVGYKKLSSTNSGYAMTSNADSNFIFTNELNDDNDTLTVTVTYGSEATTSSLFYNVMRRVAAVKIEVDYGDSGENDVFWSGITATYSKASFTLSMTALDSSHITKVGQVLDLSYTLYYDNGNRSQEINSNSYYALKAVNSSSAWYERLSDGETDSDLTYQAVASKSFYTMDEDKITESTVYVESNAGETYLSAVSQSWTVEDGQWHGYTSSGTWIDYDSPVTRTESLSYGGASLETGYDAQLVTELCELSTVTVIGTVTVETIAPVVDTLTLEREISTATATVTVGNYGLMDYPDDGTGSDTPEAFHLYYVLYAEGEDADGNTTLTLVGVVVGDTIGTDAVDIVASFTGLDNTLTYRLYVYYKDNRSDDAALDTALFSGISYTQGVFYSDVGETGSVAEALEKVINNASPTSDTVYNNFTKISGLTNGYRRFTLLSGVPFSSDVDFVLGNTESYISSTDSDASGKTMSCTVTTSYKQDDYTKCYFILERKAVGDSTWYTAMYDYNFPYSYMYDYYSDVILGLDSAIAEVSYDYYYYKNNGGYSFTDLTGSGSSYTASMSLTYYPSEGCPIEPGYTYRMKAVILQYDDEDDDKPQLVSIYSEDDDSTTYRISTNTPTWSSYTYSSLNPLVKSLTTSNRTSSSITFSFKALDYYTWVDDTCYIQVCTPDSNGDWNPVTDGITYMVGDVDYTNKGFDTSEGTTWTVTVSGLTDGTTYALQFYGLVDTDYDGYVNIASSSGTPLQQNDTTAVFAADTSGNTTTWTSNLTDLYEAYFGVASPSGGSWDSDKMSSIYIGRSTSATTLAASQSATLGTCYQYEASDSATLKLIFRNASGLTSTTAASIYYTISYFGTETLDTVSGTLGYSALSNVLSSSTDLGSDVMLTITDSNLQLQSGIWYVQLIVCDSSGNITETLSTIEVDL